MVYDRTVLPPMILGLCFLGYRSLKKNMNVSKPSEHPPSVEKMSKYLGGNIGRRDKNSSSYYRGSPMYSHMVNSIISGRSPPCRDTKTNYLFRSRCTIYLD